MLSRPPNTFKIAQLNAENLFLFLDDPSPRDWSRVSEKEWQRLSRATVPNKPLSKTLWLAEALQDIDADIVCLNEIGGEESLSNFAKYFLQGKYRPHLIEGNSDRGIDIGYLIRADFAAQVELRTHKNRPLGFLYPHEIQSNAHFAETAPEKIVKTHYFSRDCAELRITSPGADRPAVILLLVHLKSKLDPDGIDPEGRGRRQAELNALLDIYRSVRAEFTPAVPVIVAGDFNGCARKSMLSEEFAALAQTDLEGVIELAGHRAEAAATQLIFSRSGGCQPMEIDFIFVSPELKEHLILEGSEVYRYRSDLRVPLPLPATLEQRLFLPSDHYPVVALFKNFIATSS
jgi:endonuclease/exonuclease/phosphatase family metal-dependent hydrolase